MYPIISQLGYDPIRFGIMLVMVVEIGLITPPHGMNGFVLKLGNSSLLDPARMDNLFEAHI